MAKIILNGALKISNHDLSHFRDHEVPPNAQREDLR